MRRSLLALIILLIAVYPFAIYFGLHYLSPRYLALIIILVFLLRFLLLNKTQAVSLNRVVTILMTLLGIVLSIIVMLVNNAFTIRLYPFMVNFLLLGVFAYSIFSPPTIIERLARITTPNLPTAAIRYTRNVTLVWCGFFIINGSIALGTALFASLAVWTLYNGLLSYLLIGILCGTEFIIRQIVKKRILQQEPDS